MTRVGELQKKYPNLPREFIVKWDALNLGIRDSTALDKGGIWIRGISNYTRDHDMTLSESVKDRPERVRPGWIRFPGSFAMRSGLASLVKRDSRSPYEIKEAGDGKFILFEGEDKIEDVWFPGTSVGEPGDEDFWPGGMLGNNKNCGLVGNSPNAPILPQSQHCGYFANGDQCRFCNYDSNHDDALALGLRAKKGSVDEVIEHYRIRASKIRIAEVMIGSDGAITEQEKLDKAIEFNTNIIARAAAATTSYHPEYGLTTLPLSRKQLQRLKDVGGTMARYQMEVTDKELFPEVCPGKFKQFGYEGFLESMQEAVDVMGFGSVNCGLVAGATLLARNGHQTWQEARDSFNEGTRWLIKNGIMPSHTTLRPVPGSIFGDDKSNLAKLPPTEFYLEIAQAHHEAMKEFGLYEKVNKFAICPLDCSTLYYIGELGMLELAGDMGSWLADTIPFEANWLAQHVASIKSSVRIK